MGRHRNPTRTAVPILNRLFTIADERGISHAELCNRMDVYPAQITDWRSGRNTPGIFTIMSLATALGMELTLNG